MVLDHAESGMDLEPTVGKDDYVVSGDMVLNPHREKLTLLQAMIFWVNHKKKSKI